MTPPGGLPTECSSMAFSWWRCHFYMLQTYIPALFWSKFNNHSFCSCILKFSKDLKVLCHPKCISVFQPGDVVFRGTPFSFSSTTALLFPFCYKTVPNVSLFSFVDILCPLLPCLSSVMNKNHQYFLLLVVKAKTCHL